MTRRRRGRIGAWGERVVEQQQLEAKEEGGGRGEAGAGRVRVFGEEQQQYQIKLEKSRTTLTQKSSGIWREEVGETEE